MRTEHRFGFLDIELPHIVVRIVETGKTETGGNLIDVEFALECVFLHSLVGSEALLPCVADTFNFELIAHDFAVVEIIGRLEMVFEKHTRTGRHLEVVVVGGFGIAGIVFSHCRAHTHVAVREVALAGVNENIVEISLGHSAVVRHFHFHVVRTVYLKRHIDFSQT